MPGANAVFRLAAHCFFRKRTSRVLLRPPLPAGCRQWPVARIRSDTFTYRSAVWVWIPALLAFAVRVAIWRSTGSVLFHSSVVEHFITADCQLQNWRDAHFTSRCGDMLFLMQLVICPVAYSAGAAIQRIVERKRRSNLCNRRSRQLPVEWLPSGNSDLTKHSLRITISALLRSGDAPFDILSPNVPLTEGDWIDDEKQTV